MGTDSTPALSGLQVSVMKSGEMFESHALGFARIENSVPEALRIDHKLRVASISKILVAIGVMQLVDKNLLKLDQDISDYLGWSLRNPKFPQQEITARQL
ncbi:MAG: serine hydrolase domain-containing protein, partial [Pseudomonadota bacterium]|nr:serine hydrolase domain-containing protein [Pseudomonadota bacterium]